MGVGEKLVHVLYNFFNSYFNSYSNYHCHCSYPSQTKEIPESRGLFVIILLADMLNTIIRESILVANGEARASATAAVVFFVLIAFLFFGLLAILHFVYLCCLRHHYTSFISSCIQTVGALLYFYGDNITYLLNSYGVELGCGTLCQNNNRIAATFSLGLALIIFHIIPPMLHKLFQVVKDEEKKDKKNPWYSAVDMITVMVKIDTLYSAVVVMVESPEFCSASDIGVSVSFIVVCAIVGFIAEIIYFIYALYANEDENMVFCSLAIFGLILIIICFPLYILADNHQPLDCAFGCDSFAANTTINDLTCSQIANSGTRLGFTCVTFLSVSALSLVYFSCSAKENKALAYPV